MIKKLLYEDGFKIDGARRLLKEEPEKIGSSTSWRSRPRFGGRPRWPS